ncbi:MAG TPA: PAS domain S-box protein [Thermoanaerobaculia bacterium]
MFPLEDFPLPLWSGSATAVTVNRAWRALTGCESLLDACHPEDLEALQHALASGRPFDLRVRLLAADGARWFQLHGAQTDGQWTGTCVNVDDSVRREEELRSSVAERDRLENERRESEERFRLMADHAPVMIWVTDPTGACIYLNRAWYELTGQEREEAFGLGWLIPVHPEDRELTEISFLEANQRRLPYRADYRLRRHDGIYRWVIDTASPRFGPEGEFLGYIGSLIDISERREAEEALRDREAHFRLLANGMPQIVWMTDTSMRILYMNDRWSEVTGLPAVDADGLGWTAAVPEEDLANMRDVLATSVLTGEAFEYEHRLRDRRGEERWYLTRGLPVRDSAGHIIRWLGTGTDVHDFRLTLEALRLSEARVRRLVDSNVIGVVVADRDGSLLDANDRYLSMLGFTREDFEQGLLNWTKLTPREYLTQDYVAILEADTLGACIPYEKEYLRKDGSRVPVLIGFARFEAPRVEYICFVLDLTEQKLWQQREKAARETAERANRAKDEFLAILSHELRTPMTSILGWTSLLSMGIVEQETLALALQSLQGSAKLQQRLIDDLLDVSRAISGKLTIETAPVELIGVVGTVIESLRAETEAKRQQVRLTAEGSVPLMGDAKRLYQIVANLLSNAIKFTPEEGRIDVTVHRIDGFVELSVRDTGSGVDPEFLPRIFDRFAQQDASSTRSHGGLGLGLAVVRELVHLHGGTVDASSDGVGKGAEFRVRLPLIETSTAPVAAPMDDAADIPRLDGKRILVVDDEPYALAVLKTMIESSGARVTTARSVAEARSCIAAETPDLVVSDIALPGEDGYTLVREIRGRIPAIAVSAFGREENRQRSLDEGFTAYVVKPVEVVAFLQTIAAAV